MNVFTIILILTLQGCLISSGELGVKGVNRQSLRDLKNKPIILSIKIVDGKLHLSGSNINFIDKVEIKTPQKKIPLKINSIDATSLVLDETEGEIILETETLYLLLVHNETVQQDIPFKLTLEDGSIKTKHFKYSLSLEGKSFRYENNKWVAGDLTGLIYSGNWDASSGLPPSNSPQNGNYFIVTTPGSTNLSGGIGTNSWSIGDWAIWNESNSRWEKIDNSVSSISFNGRYSNVLPSIGDYSWDDISSSLSLGEIGNVDLSSETTNYLLKYDGNNWVASEDFNGEANSAVTSDFATDTIVSADISNDSIGSNQIENQSITTSHILNDNITSIKINSTSIDSIDLNDGSITTLKISDDIIDSDKIAASTIQDADINSLSQSKITNLSTDIAGKEDTITASTDVSVQRISTSAQYGASLGYGSSIGEVHFKDLDSSHTVILKAPSTLTSYTLTLPSNSGSNGQFLTLDASSNLSWATPSTTPTGSASGDLQGTYPNPTLANNSVTTNEILDGEIALSHLANSSVELGHMQSNSVGSDEITDNSVTRDDLATGSVTSIKIDDGTLVNADFSNASIGSDELAPNSVTLAKLTDESIGSSEIINGNITDNKLNNDIAQSKITDLTTDLTALVDVRNDNTMTGAILNFASSGIDDNTDRTSPYLLTITNSGTHIQANYMESKTQTLYKNEVAFSSPIGHTGFAINDSYTDDYSRFDMPNVSSGTVSSRYLGLRFTNERSLNIFKDNGSGGTPGIGYNSTDTTYFFNHVLKDGEGDNKVVIESNNDFTDNTSNPGVLFGQDGYSNHLEAKLVGYRDHENFGFSIINDVQAPIDNAINFNVKNHTINFKTKNNDNMIFVDEENKFVGINTSTPLASLHVNGMTRFESAIYFGSNEYWKIFHIEDLPNGLDDWDINDSNSTIGSSGDRAHYAPTNVVSMQGPTNSFVSIHSWTGKVHVVVDGEIAYDNNLLTTSDFRIKKDFHYYSNKYFSNKIKDIDILDYNYIHRKDSIKTGVIAQDVKDLIPNSVSLLSKQTKNILKNAIIKNDMVYLDNHKLNIGDNIKIEFKDSNDKKIKKNVKILSVNNNSFIIDFNNTDYNEEIFIIGNKYNDYHYLSIDQIKNYYIGALQDAITNLENQEDEIHELEKIYNAQEKILSKIKGGQR